MNVLEIKNLEFSYNQNLILENINLKLPKGGFMAITGANGSGKSTLIKLILGDLKKDKGDILIHGIPIEEFKNYNKIGYVPQINERNKIAFPITSYEYVILNLYEHFNFFNMPNKKCKDMVDEIFLTLNIEELKKRPVNELSGGQAQRVMIARALVNSPDILILDEPTVGVDDRNKTDFMNLLAHLNDHHDITVLLVSHENDIIKNYVKDIVELKDGRIINAKL